ncbi:MAG TPA: TetR/AcrR family transcriptional regulator [Anaerolineae bacterium]|nr:TetR/AcrR family transcriptional regulator [Anaerolineae bacterium]HID84680.1 TetR/AcrR family transcriptional regulator [Anaerolineales bacterium]HIQ09709.1 TetR/AcrR family transcriptional regulator [Anaerolineaceae bacterium]
MAPKSGKRRIGRERILQVAEEMFASQGYRAVSIREIARACGVTNAALYYHFPSKATLFREVILRHLQALRQRLLHAQATEHAFRAKLRAMLEVYAATLHEHRTSMFALRRDISAWKDAPPEERKTLFRQAWQAVIEPFATVLQEALQQGQIRPVAPSATLATMLLGLLAGVLHQPTLLNQPDIPQAVEQALEVFLHGLDTAAYATQGEDDA